MAPVPSSHLQKVGDDVQAKDNAMGLVLAKQPDIPDNDAAQKNNPPDMDTYPVDQDEEDSALQRAIKMSLSNPLNQRADSNAAGALNQMSPVPSKGELVSADSRPGSSDISPLDDQVAIVDPELSLWHWKRNEDEDEVVPTRQDGAPLALRSNSENSVWAAHVIQALISVPQVRRAIRNLEVQDNVPASMSEFFLGRYPQ